MSSDAQSPATTVASHEFVHQLRKDSPELYAEIEAEVARLGKLPEFEAELHRRGDDRAAQSTLEELTADAVGDAMTDRAFRFITCSRGTRRRWYC